MDYSTMHSELCSATSGVFLQVFRSNTPRLSEYHSKPFGVSLRDVWRITPRRSEFFSQTQTKFWEKQPPVIQIDRNCLKKFIVLGNEKKSEFSFCISLVFFVTLEEIAEFLCIKAVWRIEEKMGYELETVLFLRISRLSGMMRLLRMRQRKSLILRWFAVICAFEILSNWKEC